MYHRRRVTRLRDSTLNINQQSLVVQLNIWRERTINQYQDFLNLIFEITTELESLASATTDSLNSRLRRTVVQSLKDTISRQLQDLKSYLQQADLSSLQKQRLQQIGIEFRKFLLEYH